MNLVTDSKNIEFYTREGLLEHQACMKNLLEIFVSICDENSLEYWIDGGTLLGFYRHSDLIPWDDDIDICVPINHYEIVLDKISKFCEENNKYSLYYKGNGRTNWCEYFCNSDYIYENKEGFLKPVKIDILPVKSISEKKLQLDLRMVDDAAFYVRGKSNYNISSNIDLKGTTLKQAIDNKNTVLNNYNSYMKECIGSKDWLVKAHGLYSPIKKVANSIVYPLKKSSFLGMQVNIPNDTESYLQCSYGDKYNSMPKIRARVPYNSKTIVNNGKYNESLRISSDYDYISFYLKNIKWGSFHKAVLLIKARGIVFLIKKIIIKLTKI